jgi:acetyl-CoA carboxylase biotin carboxylase subunit
MNTRLQVEHPATELVTGLDLVRLQIRIARGEQLPFGQQDLGQRGHALECRVYAEDAEHGFLPSPGRIAALRAPSGPGVRDDSGIYEGWEVPIHYDPLLSKVVAHGGDRTEAIERMLRALAEYRILGVQTSLPFLARLLRDPDFVAGSYDTTLVERVLATKDERREGLRELAVAAAAIRAFRDRQAVRAAPGAEASSAWWRAGLAEAQGGRP